MGDPALTQDPEMSAAFEAGPWPGHSYPECVRISHKCTRTHSPHPPPGLTCRFLTVFSYE